MKLALPAALALSLSPLTPRAAPAPLDTKKIEALTGAKGTLDEKEGVFKVSLPRSDLAVVVDGVHLVPAMGLTSWAAFTRVGEHVMVMGDQVLEEAQVNPVMSVALENGLDVTALHNHFLGDAPRVMFMHVGGTGDAETLAAAIGKVFVKTRETMGLKAVAPGPAIEPAKSTLDAAALDAALGAKGTYKDGVYKVSLGRTVEMHGHAMGNAMGVNTWAAFAGSPERAVVDGDFAMLEGELTGVLKALRAAHIDVVAIHQHMTGESPRMMFLHYWAVGRAADLAVGLRAALAQTAR